MVWRDRGEPAVDIPDMHECLVHGARGGIRTFLLLPVGPPTTSYHPCPCQGAATIAFAIRSGINVILLLARIKNIPKYVCILVPMGPDLLKNDILAERSV